MINAIIESIFISLICMGIKILYSDGKLLSFVGHKLDRLYNLGGVYSYIAMPLGTCPYCMASVYGLVIHICLSWLNTGVELGWLPPVLLMSIYFNGLFWSIIMKLDRSL